MTEPSKEAVLIADRPAPEGAAPTKDGDTTRCSTPSLEDTGPVSGAKLWLWKNGDHYLAFAHEYPTYGGGDPMVLGEPAGYAVLMQSEPRQERHLTPGEQSVMRRALRNSTAESSPKQTVAPPGPTAGDVQRARADLKEAK